MKDKLRRDWIYFVLSFPVWVLSFVAVNGKAVAAALVLIGINNMLGLWWLRKGWVWIAAIAACMVAAVIAYAVDPLGKTYELPYTLMVLPQAFFLGRWLRRTFLGGGGPDVGAGDGFGKSKMRE